MHVQLYIVLHPSSFRDELQLFVCAVQLSWDCSDQCLGMLRYVGAAHAI
jgi:hypothetical protein